MTTLNARAHDAWVLVEAESEFEFESDGEAFEEGWETGYKTARAEVSEEIAKALEQAAEEIAIPGASSLAAAWLQGRATRLRNEVAS